MAKLSRLNRVLGERKAAARKQQLAGAFGVDFDALEDPKEPDQQQIALDEINALLGKLVKAVAKDTGEADALKKVANAVQGLDLGSHVQAIVRSHDQSVIKLMASLEMVLARHNDNLMALLPTDRPDYTPNVVVESPAPDPRPVRFDLERDGRGFLKTVTAVPT